MKRALARNAEWLEDLIAEARARYHAARGGVLDDAAPPTVVVAAADGQ
jgi:hypothetical protein